MTGVLVCDDAPDMRALLRDALDADPALYVVGEAADGAAALRLAEALQPDVVLLDIGMPGPGAGDGRHGRAARGAGGGDRRAVGLRPGAPRPAGVRRGERAPAEDRRPRRGAPHAARGRRAVARRLRLRVGRVVGGVGVAVVRGVRVRRCRPLVLARTPPGPRPPSPSADSLPSRNRAFASSMISSACSRGNQPSTFTRDALGLLVDREEVRDLVAQRLAGGPRASRRGSSSGRARGRRRPCRRRPCRRASGTAR